MSIKMLINAHRTGQMRIAIIEDTNLSAYQVEIAESGLCRGNIYRGVVANIQPSLNAAFVDIGEERHGFLPMGDLLASAYQKTPPKDERRPRIDQVLERGRPILVQVTKDGIGQKGPALTTNIALAGRYLVLMPFDEVRGISRKATDDDSRKKIRERLASLTLPEGQGVIVRTNGIDQNKTTLNRDLSALQRLWRRIRGEGSRGKGSRLLYTDQDLLQQALRDYLDNTVEQVIVDADEAHEHVQAYMQAFMPRSKVDLIRYTDRMPLFSRFHLEPQIERIYDRVVPLPNGGSISIDNTEALTAIDVNSGRATMYGDHEETVLNVNIEAAREVARQLRLRDIGGLVVIDFIDMRMRKSQRKLEKEMRDAMKGDKARYGVSRISSNGLVEINRQRIKQALRLRTHRACPHCTGTGSIANPDFAARRLLRQIEARASNGLLKSVLIALHPEVADALQNHHRQEMAEFEREFDIQIEIVTANNLGHSEERVEWTQRARTGSNAPPKPITALSALDLAPTKQSHRGNDDDQDEASNGTGSGRRRRRRGGRRRRRGRGNQEANGNSAEAQQAAQGHQTTDPSAEPQTAALSDEAATDDSGAPRRTRTRRRRRRTRGDQDSRSAETRNEMHTEAADGEAREGQQPRTSAQTAENGPSRDSESQDEAARSERPKRTRRRTRRSAKSDPVETHDEIHGETSSARQAEAPADGPSLDADERPKRTRRRTRRTVKSDPAEARDETHGETSPARHAEAPADGSSIDAEAQDGAERFERPKRTRRRTRRTVKSDPAEARDEIHGETSPARQAEAPADGPSPLDTDPQDEPKRTRRRTRRTVKSDLDTASAEAPPEARKISEERPAATSPSEDVAAADSVDEPKTRPTRRRTRKPKAEATVVDGPEAQATGEGGEEKPKRVRRTRRKTTEAADAEPAAVNEAASEETTETKPKTRRRRTTKKDAEAAAEAPVVEATEAEKPAPKKRTTRRKKVAEGAPSEAASMATGVAPSEGDEVKPKRTRRTRSKAADEDKPATKRTASRRKTKASETDGESSASEPQSEAKASSEAEEKPKTKRTRARRTTKAKSRTESESANKAPEADAAADGESKPKRRRTRAKAEPSAPPQGEAPSWSWLGGMDAGGGGDEES